MKTRDESGKFVATNKEMTDEQREAINRETKAQRRARLEEQD